MRTELARRVAEFRRAAENMWRENQTSVAAMQVQLAEFQKRLDRAESLASIDALTGLNNRGAGEAKLRNAIENGNLVSIVLVDLNGFKQVNDRWGHSAGDQVLRTFAHTLAHTVRAPDFVCRWGGDEFLMILSVNEELARTRALQMRCKLRILHKVVVLGRIIEVEVSASLGVAQARSGEAIEDMLTRADAELYAQKNPARTPPAGMLILEGGA
jgi:diguanylate cyclase (GGDEF)-like protein